MSTNTEWLEAQLKANKKHGKTAKELAARLGISASGVSDMLNGRREIRLDQLSIMADFFQATPPTIAATFIVPVIGKIGAGGAIDTTAENHTSPLFHIYVDQHHQPSTVAYQVSGDSMFPKYSDGDIVLVDMRGNDPSFIVGRDAVVFIADEGRFLKQIAHGSKPDLYDLISHNAPPMRDKALKWASRVKGSIPAGLYDVRFAEDEFGDSARE